MPIIASAPAEPAARGAWLERLWQAHAADEIPYIETLAAYWGALCVSKETASGWADCLLESAARRSARTEKSVTSSTAPQRA